MRYFAVLAWLFLGLSLGGCKEPPVPQVPPLLEIGQRRVTLEQLEHEVKLDYPEFASLTENDLLRVKIRLVQELIDRELIAAEAALLNIDISPDELDAAQAEVRGQYSPEEFSQFLHKQRKSPESWLAALRQRLLTAKVTAALVNQQPAIENEQLEAYYRAHKEDYRRPLEVRARQMLFHSREEAVKVRNLYREGTDFKALAQKFSLSPDRENGGDLGYFAKGMLPPEFDDAIFRLPVGQISDPVASPYGYHLFLVERRRKAGVRPYAAVKDEIYEELRQQQEENIFHQWLETTRKSTVITVRWQLLDPATSH